MAEWTAVSAHDEVLWLDLPAAQVGGEPQGLRAIWIAAEDPAAPAVPTLHGTFRNLYKNQPKIAAIHAAGFSVLAVDYRGWGESTRMPLRAEHHGGCRARLGRIPRAARPTRILA